MEHVFNPLSPPKRQFIADQQRETVRQRLITQGTGAHTPEEIYRLALKSLYAIETQLGDQLFMLGVKPTSLDATAYGFLANLIDTDFHNPLSHQAHAKPILSPIVSA